jgi:plastocyanin
MVVAAFGITPAALLAEQPAAEQVPAPAPAAAPDQAVVATGAADEAGAGVTSIETSSKATPARAARAATSASAASVTIGDFFFKPKDVTITAGQSITWTNKGKVSVGHTVTGNGFDSGVLKPGATYTHSFSSAGTFDYVCTIHPNMRGTVTVTASASGGIGGGNGENGGGGSSSSSGEGGGDSGSGGTSASGSGSSGSGSLPSTGLNLVLLAEIGICLLATGLLLRRLSSS